MSSAHLTPSLHGRILQLPAGACRRPAGPLAARPPQGPLPYLRLVPVPSVPPSLLSLPPTQRHAAMSFLKTSHASAAMSPPAPITTSSSRSLPSLAPQPAPRCIWGSLPLSAAPWWGGLLETPHLKHRPLPPRRSAHFSCTVGRSHASPSAAHLGAATPEAAFSLLAGHLPRLRGGGPRVCLLVPSVPGHGAALGQSALGPHLRADAQEDAQVSEGPQGPGPEQARASCASPPSPLGPCPPFWGCCPNAPCSGL